MPTIKYECWPKFTTKAENIKAVEVERETETSVWVGGRRRAKVTDYGTFFDTWEQARAAAVEYHERSAERHTGEAMRASQRVRDLSSLDAPV